ESQPRVGQRWENRSRPSVFGEVVSVVDRGGLPSSCQPGEVYPHLAQCKASVLFRQTICSVCPPIRQLSRFIASRSALFILTGGQRITMRTCSIERPIGPPR